MSLAPAATSLSRRLLPALALTVATVISGVLAAGACVATSFTPTPVASSSMAAPGAVESAVAFAERQIGAPYLWGGEGVGGFDCSGLVWAAFHNAGIEVPRVAQDQFDFGVSLPSSEPPRRGDLVFFGSGPNNIDHVGIVVSPDHMVDAPNSGATVRIENFHWSDYVGATRPSARG